MHHLTIRGATLEDAEKVALLARELSYPTTTVAEMALRLDAVSQSGEAVLVAVDGHEILGWIHVGGVLSIQSPAFAEIHGLVVTESRRGHGVGGALVSAAEKWAHARRFARLRVRTNLQRIQTHAFYEGRGFEETKTQKVFDKKLG